MAISSFFSTSLLLFLLLLPFASCTRKKQVYIVDFGKHSEVEVDKALHEIEDTHHSFLLSVKKTAEEARASHLYSYKHTLNGFAALLTPEEANKLSEMEGVVSVHKSQARKYRLHTTRSWEFLGLVNGVSSQEGSSGTNGDLLSRAKYGEDVIVGMIDSGVWPESQSFSDQGMAPVPQRWKGICQNGTDFPSSQCNRKIIGARYYLNGYQGEFGRLNENQDCKSARDVDGHGSHTASILGGRSVQNVSALGGYAAGTATGGAPLARLAIYKACWAFPGRSKGQGNICTDIDMLKAIDDAISDGVDVLSISIGYDQPLAYEDDMIAKAALHAVRKNIVVVTSAGNLGPKPKTLASNVAPWLLTVGASTVDRSFNAPILLDNGTLIEGQSITPTQMENHFRPLVFASGAEYDWVSNGDSGYCIDWTLDPNKVRGKVVLCMRGRTFRLDKGLAVQNHGGVGVIIGNGKENGDDVPCDAHFLPATGVSYDIALKLIDYSRTAQNPMVRILPGRTVLNTKPAPYMASFSSRGPNVIDPNILKPDITAPGVDILAAWTDGDGPTRMSFTDKRVVKYNIFSGTSMSCPHVAAAAVLLKAIHPSWSSAAIRSALMTTAETTDNMGKPLTDQSGHPATPMAFGSGHLSPIKAADPRLVYNASYTDYILYTCSLGVTQKLKITYHCPKSPPEPVNLNYPSIQIHRLYDIKTIRRTVTNVGSSSSVYTFSAKAPKQFFISASPNILKFDRVGQEISFNITVIANRGYIPSQYDPDEYYFGWYTWSYGSHTVRSPVAVSFA